MRSDGRRGLRTLLLALAAAVVAALPAACGDGGTDPDLLPPVDSVRARPLGPTTAEIAWRASPGVDVAYVIERREDLQGEYREVQRVITGLVGSAGGTWVDTSLEPERVYGYRVYGVTSLSGRTAPSFARSVVTPPPPGITVLLRAIGEQAVNLASVTLRVLRGDTLVRALPVRPTLPARIAPLPDGEYRVAVDLPSTCAINGGPPRSAVVRSDRGVRTLDSLRVEIFCRDPSRGEILVKVAASGTSLDTTYTIRVQGAADDASLPDTARLVNRRDPVVLAGGQPAQRTYSLRPGTYTFLVDDIADNCTLQPAGVTRQAVGGVLDTLQFGVTCTPRRPPAPPLSERPYRLIHAFTRPQAAPGDTVSLAMTWAMRTASPKLFTGVQFELGFDAGALEYLGTTSGSFPIFAVGQSAPGLLSVLLSSATGPTSADSSNLGALRFRVRAGATPRFILTETKILEISLDGLAGTFVDTARAWPDEADLEIIAGSAPPSGGGTPPSGGGGTNPPPPSTVVAEANGPYSGAAGSPVIFSSAGSSTGSDVTYRWFFPGGLESTQQNPTFTFSTAGTYTVRLEVTRAGVIARDSAIVTISAPTAPPPSGGGGGTTPPPPPTGGPRLFYSFASNPTGTVTMTVFLDLTADVAATNGPEVLGGWSLQEIRFDPAVLEWVQGSIRLGQYHSGVTTISQDRASQGILTLLNVSTEAGRPNRTGLITLARIDFRPVGTRGASMTTRTALGAIIGAGEVSFYNYTPLVTVQEGTYVIP